MTTRRNFLLGLVATPIAAIPMFTLAKAEQGTISIKGSTVHYSTFMSAHWANQPNGG